MCGADRTSHVPGTGKAGPRLLCQGATLLAALLLAADRLDAQAATGKLEGRVRDPTGFPLAESQVYIWGRNISG